jgi:hypothetical protein
MDRKFSCSVAAVSLALMLVAPALAQEVTEEEYRPAPPNEEVALAEMPPELQAAVKICYRGGLVPERLAEQAARYEFLPLPEAERAELVASKAVQGLQGWAEGEGAARVRVVTYLTEIAGRPHSVCLIDAASPRPAAAIQVLSRAFGAPRRDSLSGDKRTLSWYWQEDGRYAMADYTTDLQLSDGRLIVKASLAQ